ncbi:MAG: protein kinase [Polyangiaceae bacterium]|nr:protein kinase [Polyangiaceae bacterium]
MSVPTKPITAIDEKYRVIASVGRGAVADVNLAVARGPGGFNKLVVLKSLREELRGIEGYSELFMTEARLNAQLSHPHIVQTNEIFDFEGLPVIVMEYLEGQSLGAVVRMARKSGSQPAFDRSMHLRVLSDVLHALDYAHNKRGLDGNPLSLVHCDVSPQNVFLTYEGEVKLLDFGIARQVCAQGARDLTHVRGKARYMPPEQIDGEGIDQRTDLYAVGVMAWEAAAGARLWANADDDQILRSVLAGEIPAPSSVVDQVDPELERIVMRALEPDKEQRYPTALAMQVELDRFLGISGTQLRSRDIGAAVSVLFADRRAQTEAIVADQLAKLATLPEGAAELRLVELPQISLASDVTPMPEPAKRRRALPVAAVIVAALLAAFGAVLWASGGEANERTEVPVSRSVELRITAFPAEATVALDGVALGVNPYSQVHERSSEEHEIRVTAPGYETAVRTITLEDSADVVIALKALPTDSRPTSSPDPPPIASAGPPQASPADPVASPPSGGSVPRSSMRRRDCNPPAYFDAKGIKHFKPQCL